MAAGITNKEAAIFMGLMNTLFAPSSLHETPLPREMVVQYMGDDGMKNTTMDLWDLLNTPNTPIHTYPSTKRSEPCYAYRVDAVPEESLNDGSKRTMTLSGACTFAW